MIVTLLRTDGSDLDVVNAARVSFDKESRWEADGTFYPAAPPRRLCDKDQRLVGYLARHEHWSPFAHVGLSLHVKAPIFVARQLAKHQVGACIAGDTEITFVKVVNGKSSGTRKVTVADLWKTWNGLGYHANFGRHQVSRRRVRVLNCSTGFFEAGSIIEVVKTGVKPMFEITSENGRSIRLTADHRVYTEDGWLPMKDAIGLELSSRGIATMSRETRLGMNGRQYGGYDTYRVHDWMKARREEGLDLTGIADAADCATHTIRKWLKQHGLQFNPIASMMAANVDGPWNKGKSGYRLPPKSKEERRRLSEIRSGAGSNFWRGGVTSDRAMINAWTRRNSAACHRRHGWTCQRCEQAGGSLEAHHIVPVAQSPELARDFDNLASVCAACHDAIHASLEAEFAFADMMRHRERIVTEYTPKPRKLAPQGLRVHFEKIISIRYCGEQEVFDISVDHPDHNFVGNGFVLHNCWNEVSRRYIDSPPEFYAPAEDGWRVRAEDKKQGSLDETLEYLQAVITGNEYNGEVRLGGELGPVREFLSIAADVYSSLLAQGVAPEQARMVLPACVFTQWRWTGSLLFFARVCRLRLAPDAQAETREIAAQIAAIAAEAFPVSWAALMGGGP